MVHKNLHVYTNSILLLKRPSQRGPDHHDEQEADHEHYSDEDDNVGSHVGALAALEVASGRVSGEAGAAQDAVVAISALALGVVFVRREWVPT